MKHIRNFGGFKNKPEVENINEHVIQVDNTYQVSVIAKVEAKLLSTYSKKVEQNTGIKVADVYGNNQLAELLVAWVLQDGLDADKIPATAIVGGSNGQGQTQAQLTPQAQVQVPQVQVPQVQNPQVQVQSAPAGGGSMDGAEEDLPI